MSKTIFLSSVSKEFGKLRLRLANFGQRTHKLLVRHQDAFANAGVVTLQMLEEEIRKSDYVVHLIGQDAGWAPPIEQINEFLDRHSSFREKFPAITEEALQGLISATQWEAWLGLYFDETSAGELRRVFSYEIAEPLHVGSRQQIHSRQLAASGHYPKKLEQNQEFFDEIVLSLIEQKILAETDFKQNIRNRVLTPHTAEHFFGRTDTLTYLDEKFADGTNLLSIIAWGGVGKTSLLVHWVETRFVANEWKQNNGLPLVDAFIEWSFYAHGTGALEDNNKVRNGNIGNFFQSAFESFGDRDYISADKGKRLAKHFQGCKALLIVDGLDPLQYPPNHNHAGEILDPDLRDLIEQLAAYNPGLCIITSREHLRYLQGQDSEKTTSQDLEDLDETAAIELLRSMQVNGTDEELAEASQEYQRHALSLTLIGRFLADAYDGDIRKRDQIRDLKEADDLTRPERHRSVWKIMASYQAWLQQKGPGEKSRCLNILRLTGLFDSAISSDCQDVLRTTSIPGITDAIQDMKNTEWNIELKRLERNKLLKLLPDRSGRLKIEVHPLIRAFFAKQLQDDHTEAFQLTHSLLFDHLCASTPYQPEGLEGLARLYQAVVHGCLAGRHQEALEKVYFERIQRGQNYAMEYLGSTSNDLAVLSSFFVQPYSIVSENLSRSQQAFVFNDTGLRLRSLGRLGEAISVLSEGLKLRNELNEYKDGAINAINLAELHLVMGSIGKALEAARKGQKLASMGNDDFWHTASLTTVGESLFHLGRFSEADREFQRAEALQRSSSSEPDLLYGLWGYRRRDYFLRESERLFWQIIVSSRHALDGLTTKQKSMVVATLNNLERQSLDAESLWSKSGKIAPPLTLGYDRLLQARCEVYRSLILGNMPNMSILQKLSDVVGLFRSTRHLDHLPKALLMLSTYLFIQNELELCETVLKESQQIARRASMELYLADIHLHRARLFRDRDELARAAKLIHDLGFGRRYEELADAEDALGKCM